MINCCSIYRDHGPAVPPGGLVHFLSVYANIRINVMVYKNIRYFKLRGQDLCGISVFRNALYLIDPFLLFAPFLFPEHVFPDFPG